LNPNRFEVVEEERDGVRILAVTGELDLHTSPQLEERLENVEGGLLVDLSNCEFIDSTGIGLIVRTRQRLDTDRDGGDASRFALCGLGDQVQRLLEITGLESSLRTYAEREEALAELRDE
jgi:anti-anti-sigma factor